MNDSIALNWIMCVKAERGFPEPSIVELGLRVRFVFPLARAITVEEPAELQQESRLKSPLAAKVILFLEKEPSGKAGLAKKLGHKTVSGELHKQIRRLLEMGMIEMTIPEKPNSRLQKYRLTENGKQALKEEKGEGRREKCEKGLEVTISRFKLHKVEF